MKNLIYAILLLVMIGLASCSSYTCPTYSKAPATKADHSAKI